jgi:hypothetical protein
MKEFAGSGTWAGGLERTAPTEKSFNNPPTTPIPHQIRKRQINAQCQCVRMIFFDNVWYTCKGEYSNASSEVEGRRRKLAGKRGE